MSYRKGVDAEKRRQARWKRAEQRVLIDGRLVATGAQIHGRVSTYGNWKCRCVPCTRAHTARQFEERAKRRASRVLIDGRWTALGAEKHNDSTYTNWSCRCRPCTDAFNLSMTYDAERRRIKRAQETAHRPV